ncbi:MAG: hypothetical protein R3B70_02630 [Polyangiaceae bacterium]
MADEKRPEAPLGARAPDDYEARYMAGEGVLYRDKIRVPGKFLLIVLLPIVIQLIAFGSVWLAGGPMPLTTLLALPLTVLVMAAILLLFAVLRITVTRAEVIVQYGLFGPRIPVGGIQKCEAVTYDWKTYGGWGIRRGRDGSWAYNMVGDAGRAVRVEWTNAKGKKVVTLLASPNPDALSRAINEARSVAAGKAPAKLRVAPEPRMAEFDADAEAEVEAILAEEEQKKERREG